MLKKTVIALYIVVVAVMAATTIIEKYKGTPYVSDAIYGAWWFAALWAILTAVAVFYFIKRRVRRPMVVALHLSFVIILAGALLTHLTARRGLIHLRQGQPTSEYLTEDMQIRPLPFTITLQRFEVKYHEGTDAAMDYVSHLTISSDSNFSNTDNSGNSRKTEGIESNTGGKGRKTDAHAITVSMNNIASYDGVRLYQSSFDEDMQGSLLAMNTDPWGIPVTYAGYALLFVSLLWMLIDPRGQFRQLLRRAAVVVLLLIAGLHTMKDYGIATASPLAYGATEAGSRETNETKPNSDVPRTLPQETAARFGQLYVVYNDRVCPMQTYALDFTKKLYGKRSYNGLSAEQVLTGFIFFYDDWRHEPIIKIKGSEMKLRLNLPDFASFDTFFTHSGYSLGPYLGDKDVRKVDEKVSLIMELHQGRPLKIFPYTDRHTPADSFNQEKGEIQQVTDSFIQEKEETQQVKQDTSSEPLRTTWYAPTDNLPETMDAEHQKYMREVFSLLNGEIQAGRYAVANQYLDKMLKYQQTFGRTSIPSPTRTQAERIYNKIPFATILFMVCLTLGILSFGLMLRPSHPSSRKAGVQQPMHAQNRLRMPSDKLLCTVQQLLLSLCWLALTVCLALRWMVTGNVPMSNGYETMLFLAWAVMLLSLLVSRRFPVMLTFGFLLSGFFLLASHISQMDPQMTHLMPVLNSPLLTLHVSIIMMAYALLSLTFISSLTAMFLKPQTGQLTLLSQLMLYPALTCLGFGIFIGAIWANISWGTYWSWDPKETWALITFMVYAVPAHKSFSPLSPSYSPLKYHLYMVLSFLTLLMTYFGVNYFLGGMHAYT